MPETVNTCAACGSIVSAKRGISYNFYDRRNNHQPIFMCFNCLPNYTALCDDCNDVFYYMLLFPDRHTGQGHICESCLEKRRFKPQVISEHDSKPLLGIELEVSFSKCVTALKEESAHVIPVEIGSDCSIRGNDGIEFRLMPMSREWIYAHRGSFVTWLARLRNATGVSDNSHCCGIHIHFSREGTTSAQLLRVCRLIYNNYSFWAWLSQRDAYSIAHYAHNLPYSRQPTQESHLIRSEKYDAVNLCHADTVELRIFAGTLNPKEFIKNIEAVLAIVDFCAEDNATDLTTFLTWLSEPIRQVKYYFLCRWLKQKYTKDKKSWEAWMNNYDEYRGLFNGFGCSQKRAKKVVEDKGRNSSQEQLTVLGHG